MKIIGIIQARMGSTRLPGKILKKVDGKTLLEYQIERVKRSLLINEIVVATTIKDSDDEIVNLCNELEIKVYRGSEDDVLSRYYEAATIYKADVIVRLTSDCPIIDPDIIDKTIKTYLDNAGNVDYVSNTLERSFPRGLDTEVFSFKALKNAYENSVENMFREHVTSYIYSHPNLFTMINVASENEAWGNHRWTVDTEEDLQLVKNIISTLYSKKKDFRLIDVIELLDKNPDWNNINKHIEQKKLI